MKRLTNIIHAGLPLLLISGCVNTELVSDIDPSADLVSLQSFYVAKSPTDDRGIEAIIAAELNAMGKDATSGSDPKPTVAVDAVVTYVDKWMWDITMYLIELTVDLHDPATDYRFATARSYRTSLARKSPEEMVNEVLGKLFEIQAPGEAE